MAGGSRRRRTVSRTAELPTRAAATPPAPTLADQRRVQVTGTKRVREEFDDRCRNRRDLLASVDVGHVLMPGDPFHAMSGPKSWGVSVLIGLPLRTALGYLIFTVGLGIGDTDVFDFGGDHRRDHRRCVVVLAIVAAVMKNRDGPTDPPRSHTYWLIMWPRYDPSARDEKRVVSRVTPPGVPFDYPWVVARNESGQVYVCRCDARLTRARDVRFSWKAIRILLAQRTRGR